MHPKAHHRAHYETEGSRGAIKAASGGHPVVKVSRYGNWQPAAGDVSATRGVLLPVQLKAAFFFFFLVPFFLPSFALNTHTHVFRAAVRGQVCRPVDSESILQPSHHNRISTTGNKFRCQPGTVFVYICLGGARAAVGVLSRPGAVRTSDSMSQELSSVPASEMSRHARLALFIYLIFYSHSGSCTTLVGRAPGSQPKA